MREGWYKARLGELATVQSGSGFPTKYQGEAGQAIPFYKVSDMNITGNELAMIHENNSVTEDVRKTLGAFLFPKGSVIFPKIGGAIATNKKRLTTRDCCVDNNVMGVVPLADKIDSDFLYYFLLRHDLSEFANKAHLPSIKKTVVEDWPIFLPRAISEQKRIVGVLDEALNAIAAAKANTKKNFQNARALFESHLQSVFTNRGERWKRKPLGELCELISGQHIDAKDYNTDSRGVGYLTGPSDFGFMNPVVTKWTEHPKRMARKGDILITVKGSGVGKINLSDIEEVAISRQLMAVRATASDVQYLYAFLSTKFDYFQSLSNGAAIPGISRPDVLNLICPLPPPDEEQAIVEKILAMSEETQRLESVFERKLAALEALGKSLLHQAFSGQL
jgi:type I restriction enzyme S subunit